MNNVSLINCEDNNNNKLCSKLVAIDFWNIFWAAYFHDTFGFKLPKVFLFKSFSTLIILRNLNVFITTTCMYTAVTTEIICQAVFNQIQNEQLVILRWLKLNEWRMNEAVVDDQHFYLLKLAAFVSIHLRSGWSSSKAPLHWMCPCILI